MSDDTPYQSPFPIPPEPTGPKFPPPPPRPQSVVHFKLSGRNDHHRMDIELSGTVPLDNLNALEDVCAKYVSLRTRTGSSGRRPPLDIFNLTPQELAELSDEELQDVLEAVKKFYKSKPPRDD